MTADTQPTPPPGTPPPEEFPRKGIEQRRHPRYNFVIPVVVRVLVEEDTFNPLLFVGQTCNISESGMLVRIEGLSEENYKVLIRRQRMIRVHAKISEVESDVIFFGRIVWYDFDCADRETSCSLGISFEPLQGEAHKVLHQLIERLATAQPPSQGRTAVGQGTASP